jgi:RNA polymerase sigma-70 factor (ECF subfamily)
VLRAWRFWDHYAPGSNLRAWLHRILRNTFVNRYRSNRREAELMTQVRLISAMEAPRDPDPVPAVLSEQLQTGLSGLSPRLSAVLCAVAVDELSYREAAETLGCPIGTVMSRLHRARGALRQHLEPSPTQKCA